MTMRSHLRRRGSYRVRVVALPMALLAGGLVLAACGSGSTSGSTSGSDGDLTKLTLMLNWTPNAHHAGIYVAKEQGWYADEGIDLTIIEPADAGVEQAVASGAADIGMAQAESLLPARAAGVPVVSIAAVLPVNDSSLYSLAADGITRPKDLEGKRYGGFGGALETEIISSLVTCDGGDPSKVESVTIGNVDYLAGLQQDAFDVAWVFSGWDALRASEVEGQDVDEIRFADWLSCIPNWYTPLFMASESTIADRADLVRSFLAATARGYEEAVSDPAAAAEALTSQVPELDPALVSAATDYYAPLFTAGIDRWGLQDAEVWADFSAYLTDSGILTDEVDPDEAYTNDLLPGD